MSIAQIHTIVYNINVFNSRKYLIFININHCNIINNNNVLYTLNT